MFGQRANSAEKSFGATSRMALSSAPGRTQLRATSHSAIWRPVSSARFPAALCGASAPSSSAMIGQKACAGGVIERLAQRFDARHRTEDQQPRVRLRDGREALDAFFRAHSWEKTSPIGSRRIRLAAAVARRGRAVDEREPAAGVPVDEPRGGIDAQRRTAHDQQVGAGDGARRAAQHAGIERFPVEHDVGLDRAAAGALWHAGRRGDPFGRIGFPAARAEVAVNRPVQLEQRASSRPSGADRRCSASRRRPASPRLPIGRAEGARRSARRSESGSFPDRTGRIPPASARRSRG